MTLTPPVRGVSARPERSTPEARIAHTTRASHCRRQAPCSAQSAGARTAEVRAAPCRSRSGTLRRMWRTSALRSSAFSWMQGRRHQHLPRRSGNPQDDSEAGVGSLRRSDVRRAGSPQGHPEHSWGELDAPGASPATESCKQQSSSRVDGGRAAVSDDLSHARWRAGRRKIEHAVVIGLRLKQQGQRRGCFGQRAESALVQVRADPTAACSRLGKSPRGGRTSLVVQRTRSPDAS